MVCSEEEVSFNRTLDKGIARFKKAAAAAKAEGQKDIDSKDAFEMWDTYGFPVDLTQVKSHSMWLKQKYKYKTERAVWRWVFDNRFPKGLTQLHMHVSMICSTAAKVISSGG